MDGADDFFGGRVDDFESFAIDTFHPFVVDEPVRGMLGQLGGSLAAVVVVVVVAEINMECGAIV